MKHFPYSLLVAASLLFLPVPAQAARIESWRFDARQNQLEFATDQDVQPRAQLITDPTRLVIDLPGIRLGRPSYTEPVVNGGPIRSVRFGQFDPQTARIVIELAPGYTLDPSQVKFRGITPQRWTVQLPSPQPIADQPPTSSTPPVSSLPPSNPLPGRSDTVIQGVRLTPDGLYVQTSGQSPQIQQSRSSDRQQIVLDFPGTSVAAGVARDQLLNHLGIRRLQITQLASGARITLNVNSAASDWRSSVSPLGGVVLLPGSGPIANVPDDRPAPTPSVPPSTSRLATIESVSLEDGGSRLLVRGDQPLRYSTGWDRATASYRITINNAKLASSVQGPNLTADSRILRLRLRQENPSTVVILMQPAANVQIREVTLPGQQQVALQFDRSAPPLFPPTSSNPPVQSIPVPAPPRPITPTPDIPPVPNGRVVVIVDPGHGGPDPGAIGIGGLQEKGIVLDVSRQVAAILARQGVQAILTRDSDIDLDLEPRVQMAQRANATVFVSIHANAIDMSRPDVNGLETYYYQSGAELAKTIHSSILEIPGVVDRRVRTARFYVLRRTSMPSVLVELGFVTGRTDAARLSSAEHRSQLAQAIARGILQYLQRAGRR